VTAIVSIGSGTIMAGRKMLYVNDSYLTSGSVVAVTLADDMTESAGNGGLKYINFTAGSPANGNSFQVVLNGPVDKNTDLNYTIIQ
jgi:hypothetical protein